MRLQPFLFTTTLTDSSSITSTPVLYSEQPSISVHGNAFQRQYQITGTFIMYQGRHSIIWIKKDISFSSTKLRSAKYNVGNDHVIPDCLYSSISISQALVVKDHAVFLPIPRESDSDANIAFSEATQK